jgi:hypothetical protein
MATWIVMAALFVGIVAWDIWLAATGRKTISQVVRGWGRASIPAVIVIAFGFGLLAGHFFWADCTPFDCRALGYERDASP